MRKLEFSLQLDLIAGALSDARRRPFTYTVCRHKRRIVERTGEEGARGVTLMMADEHDGSRRWKRQLVADEMGNSQLLLEPKRNGRLESAKAPGCERDVRLEEAVEFQERLVIERNIIKIARCESSFRQTIGDCMFWKGVIMFDAGESFFLRGGNDVAVDDQRCGAIVVERRD